MPPSTPPHPRPSTSKPARPAPPRTAVLPAAAAAAADAALILVFAAIGRDTHQRGEAITGVFATAWPFLAGAAVSWLALRLWRAPLAPWPAGVSVWLGTVSVGMLLRAVTGQAVVLPFVIVAFLSLAVSLLGYRLAVAGVRRFTNLRHRA